MKREQSDIDFVVDMFVRHERHTRDADIRKAVDILHKDDPELVSEVRRFVTTGCEGAKAYLEGYTCSVFLSFMDHTVVLPTIHGSKYVEHLLYGQLRYDLTMRWNAINLAHETGHEDHEYDVDNFLHYMEENLKTVFPDKDERKAQKPDHLWRGLCAFTLLTISMEPEMYEDAPDLSAYRKDFIEFTGSNPEVKTITDIAIARGIADVNEIKAIMEQQKHSAPAVYEGIL